MLFVWLVGSQKFEYTAVLLEVLMNDQGWNLLI